MMDENFEFSGDIDQRKALAEAGEQGYTDAQNKLSECCGESAPKGKRGRGEDEAIGPFKLILGIVVVAFGAVNPFVMPEATGMTPARQFIIAYLYSLVLLIETVFERISMRSKAIILLLYFLSWAASIIFGFLVLGGEFGLWMIFFPITFWALILSVRYFKNLYL